MHMLIIDDNSVYEIDEKCMQKRKVSKECQTYEKMQKKEKNVLKREESNDKFMSTEMRAKQ